jgi:WD40 repeat protein
MYAPGREGTILTVGGRGARLRLASQGTGAVQMSYRSPTRVQSVAFSPDSRLLAAVGDDEGSIKLWRLDDATNTWVADRKLMGQHQGAVRSVVFHPTDENKMLTAGADGSAKLWQRGADDWQVVVTFGEGQTAPLNQAIFSPAAEDGSVQVLTASDDGKVRIYQESGELVRDDISHEASVRCVAMSADRAWIVAGTGNHAVVWKASDRSTKPATTLDGHVAEVTSLAFSTDGRLITASMDKTAKLWDPQSWGATGADAAQAHVGELLTLSEHTDAVMSICLFHNADYPTIVTAGVDGQAILWPSMDWRTVPVQALGRR